MGDQCTLRLMRELRQLQNGDSLAMTVHYNERDICDIWALIIGSPGTPYAYGFYEFAIKIGPEYPATPPKVTLKTTNRGMTRFGPNLYSCGKVCLSILGTWSGNSGEQWSPAQGLESVLLSIQSLLSTNPFYNEPGYERASTRNGKTDDKRIRDYNSKISHENLRLTVIGPLENILKINVDSSQENSNTSGLYWHEGVVDDYMKQRFLWYLEQYKQVIEEESQDIHRQKRHKAEFPMAPFEHGDNKMKGSWDYPELKKRLNNLQAKLMEETASWADQGRELVEKEAGIAVSLSGQHGQIVSQLHRITESMVELEMINDNPFLWRLTYFGRPMTKLDGGVLRMKIHISPRHPVEQPRVFFETPIFHVRVSPLGMMIYLPARAEEMSRHIEGIINTLEEDTPPYNPLMTVNPEATSLCWGSKEEQRLYNRKLRVSLAEATENLSS